tara:strand:+ start:729 stop:965 length:237 start_codon:yes stop_codon:yes gene_type:complete
MKNQPTKKQQPQIMADLASIAKEVFGVPTLNERGNDSLDFHDGISVHDISRALEAAYMAGRKDAMREASAEAVSLMKN